MIGERERYQLARQRGVADLRDRVVLVLTGADRVRYLNGQVTANVLALRPGRAQPACVTTAKGRLCAEIVVTAMENAIYVDADASVADSLRPRLERYIIADDVTVSDGAGEARLLHFIGSPPTETLRGLGAVTIVEARRFGGDGWDLWYPPRAELWTTLTTGYEVLDESLCETLRIEAGVPRWGRELDERTLPPEAGLDRTHIDYHKGCYVGQEVISRLKSVGHVNRQLTGFAASSTTPLAAGSEVFAEADPATPCGNLTSATWSFALDKPIALGYLKRAAPLEGLFARAAGGEALPIVVHRLPFTS